MNQLKISDNLWSDLIKQLKKRGDGTRESGAFLLGPTDKYIITHFICYDDLDPDCLDSGYIQFDGNGFTPLWHFCLKNGLKVYADVHTHPHAWTNQSTLDINHPMIAQVGHIALIIPHYATGTGQFLKGVGVFEYLGDKKWKTITNLNQVTIIKENYGFIRKYYKQIIYWFN